MRRLLLVLVLLVLLGCVVPPFFGARGVVIRFVDSFGREVLFGGSRMLCVQVFAVASPLMDRPSYEVFRGCGVSGAVFLGVDNEVFGSVVRSWVDWVGAVKPHMRGLWRVGLRVFWWVVDGGEVVSSGHAFVVYDPWAVLSGVEEVSVVVDRGFGVGLRGGVSGGVHGVFWAVNSVYVPESFGFSRFGEVIAGVLYVPLPVNVVEGFVSSSVFFDVKSEYGSAGYSTFLEFLATYVVGYGILRAASSGYPLDFFGAEFGVAGPSLSVGAKLLTFPYDGADAFGCASQYILVRPVVEHMVEYVNGSQGCVMTGREFFEAYVQDVVVDKTTNHIILRGFPPDERSEAVAREFLKILDTPEFPRFSVKLCYPPTPACWSDLDLMLLIYAPGCKLWPPSSIAAAPNPLAPLAFNASKGLGRVLANLPIVLNNVYATVIASDVDRGSFKVEVDVTLTAYKYTYRNCTTRIPILHIKVNYLNLTKTSR